MELVSIAPFRAAAIPWQPAPSSWVLTVVCKATWLLRPGEAALAAEQEALNEQDEHWDDNLGRSIFAPTDLVPIKKRAEVMLVGHAFAPGRLPVRSLVARLTVGDVDKAIEVFCDRTFAQDGTAISMRRRAISRRRRCARTSGSRWRTCTPSTRTS